MEVEHAVKAGKAGADLIGMVFADSKRQVTIEKAAYIVESIRDINPRPEVVGVFMNTPAREVNRIARECRLDRVQLSGDESIEYCREITLPIIKVLHIGANTNTGIIPAQAQKWYDAMKGREFLCLLDTVVDGHYGGTGKVFVMIAGGLTPENVAQMVREVKPWGADVSSGVETNGRKDPQKIESFIRAVWNSE
jgi:phosphoribosylanthranilate isomerase